MPYHVLPSAPLDFNPRSHEGSDYRFLKGSRSGYYFNPRSHEGSDDRVQCILCAITQFQSTLPRGERQCRLKYEIEQAEISIHAPTRGATLFYTFAAHILGFQSTLPRGERPVSGSHTKPSGENFNPRSHEGSDRVMYPLLLYLPYFNPRSHEGSDVYWNKS